MNKEERWYEQVPLEEFGPDFREIAEIVGIEKAIELYRKFSKTTVIFSNAPLYSAKKYWIRQNQHVYRVNAMARLLDVSPRFVYSAFEDEPTLFD